MHSDDIISTLILLNMHVQILNQVKALGGVKVNEAGGLVYSEAFSDWVLSDHYQIYPPL